MNGLTRFGLAGTAVIAVVLVRGIVLASTPLSFDEAYYWLWSKHLASGYLDHPPFIAFLIRAGTVLFGDTSTGVRAGPWLLSAAATWAVWRTALIFDARRQTAAVAALMFNVMPMIAIESGVATPDAPEIAAAAFMLLFLAKISQTDDRRWWIAVGIAAGLALLAKYTAFFLGAGILFWLAVVPKQRHWLVSIWTYLGAAIALLMFAPVVVWNAQHGWISFAMQFGRAGSGGFTLRYLGEFAGGQLLLASPFIAVLATTGAVLAFRRFENSNLRLPVCLMLPAAGYFLVHSLHDRVQGNWPSFLYPALAVLAGAAYVKLAAKTSRLELDELKSDHQPDKAPLTSRASALASLAIPAPKSRAAISTRPQGAGKDCRRARWLWLRRGEERLVIRPDFIPALIQFTRRAAVPVAALLVAAIYGQALFGAVHTRDPVSRLLAYGIGPVVRDIGNLSAREHASAVVTTNYALTGWLAFYLDGRAPVVQLNERLRYLNEASPDPQQLRGPLIYVSQVRNEEIDYLMQRFAHVVPLEHVLRMRNGAVLDQYAIYRLDGPKAALLSYDTK